MTVISRNDISCLPSRKQQGKVNHQLRQNRKMNIMTLLHLIVCKTACNLNQAQNLRRTRRKIYHTCSTIQIWLNSNQVISMKPTTYFLHLQQVLCHDVCCNRQLVTLGFFLILQVLNSLPVTKSFSKFE